MNHPTQSEFEAALLSLGFILDAEQAFNGSERTEPTAERRDCDEMPLGVPRG